LKARNWRIIAVGCELAIGVGASETRPLGEPGLSLR